MILIRLLRFVIRLVLLIFLIIVGLFLTGLVFPLISQSQRERIVKGWSRLLIMVLGVKVKIEGAPVQDSAVMLVANHVSWIDIFILNSCRTTSFVAKKEIKDWPIVGRLVAQAGTIFVDRSSRTAMRGVNKELDERYAKGICTGLFPEGTTSDGLSVKSFFGGLLDAPLKAKVPIQPVAILFYFKGERSGYPSFIGDETLVHNIWVLLSNPGIAVIVRFLEPLNQLGVASDLNRVEAANLSYELIKAEVERDVLTETPVE
ncbi:MAG: lysophospholipid acyltransferase family protein [Alcaligenaceae bacterium]|nr:lysophospholipid acyltransferase family protein [Alcaligenaceae bacterium]